MSTVVAPPLTKVPNYINGQWRDSSASEWQDVINPATGEAITKVPLSDVAEVSQAIEAAAAAYPPWPRTPPENRIKPLLKLKKLLNHPFTDLSRLFTKENGKTFTKAK